MKVEVTQYMRPDGRQVPRCLEIPDNHKDKYQEIVDCGLRLTTEQLMSGMVSTAIEGKDFDFDIRMTKGSDFDENKRVLEKMILDFDKERYLKQQAEYDKVTT